MSIRTNVFQTPASLATRIVACTAVLICAAAPAAAQTLERIKTTGAIKLGYLTDAKPFSFQANGAAEGFGIDLCKQVADQVKAKLGLAQLNVEWVPITGASDVPKLSEGAVDLLCTPAVETLVRREQVSFSIPVFPAGVRAVLRKDAPVSLRQALGEGQPKNARPVWRGSPAAKTLDTKSFAVMTGTTTEGIVEKAKSTFGLQSKTVPVPDYRSGLQAVLDGKADVFFGDRAVALGAMDENMHKNLVIFDRMLTQEPVALMLKRGDEDFRLLVDRALSETYLSAGFGALYEKSCGKMDDATRTFFTWMALKP